MIGGAQELLEKELELRQLLLDHLDRFQQDGGPGEGPGPWYRILGLYLGFGV